MSLQIPIQLCHYRLDVQLHCKLNSTALAFYISDSSNRETNAGLNFCKPSSTRNSLRPNPFLGQLLNQAASLEKFAARVAAVSLPVISHTSTFTKLGKYSSPNRPLVRSSSSPPHILCSADIWYRSINQKLLWCVLTSAKKSIMY
jgi:hypothetical protein